MKPRINFITLGVNDLQQALEFYRDGLGLPTKGIIGTEFPGDAINPTGDIVMFELEGGSILALYPRSELAKDSKQRLSPPSPTEFSLGYTVSSQEEVDQLLKRAQAAGATLTDKAHNRPWGIYSGYFKDLDGHLWEVVYDPASQ
jgi:catechol 2,3-dioxygenase-like lactoylglutathione lyase family enzyme